MPDDIVDDLSSDQYYGYRICLAVMSGYLDPDLQKLQIGPIVIVHSRWLTLACRILRFYTSTKQPSKTLEHKTGIFLRRSLSSCLREAGSPVVALDPFLRRSHSSCLRESFLAKKAALENPFLRRSLSSCLSLHNCLSLLASACCRKLWPYVDFVSIFSA